MFTVVTVAPADSFPGWKIFKTKRRGIVGYRPKGGDRSTPQVSIAGKWRAETGFETGQAVTVRVEAGCLILMAGS
ncbi:SymE family type I addiction module toxin [Pantoea cypripedii]|uniref:SymE family type I addiction module toxin n=1 Tax=Pantoea cypripedii TaxID=55209 RepID=UPI0039F20C27